MWLKRTVDVSYALSTRILTGYIEPSEPISVGLWGLLNWLNLMLYAQ